MKNSFLAMLLIAIACRPAAPPPTDTVTQTTTPTATTETVTQTAPGPAPAAAAGPRVIFPDGFVVKVELATDPDTRAQGLMFRDHLRPGTGMLFFFPADGDYGFWMKNTIIPLDMIWIDSTRKIVHVKHEVPPCKADPCPSYPPGVDARYVLEVAGGVAKEHGLKAGDALRFEELDNVVVR